MQDANQGKLIGLGVFKMRIIVLCLALTGILLYFIRFDEGVEKLIAPGSAASVKRVALDSSFCSRLGDLSTSKVVQEFRPKVLEPVSEEFGPLMKYGTLDSVLILKVVPEEVQWWLGATADLPAGLKLGAAIHESHHSLNGLLVACRGRSAFRYLFLGNVYSTEFSVGSFPLINIVHKHGPQAGRASIEDFRYSKYVIGSELTQGNDLSILLEEIVAHASGARVEWNYYRTTALNPGALRKIPKISGNIRGLYDMLAILDIYLTILQLHYPEKFRMAFSDAGFSCLLSSIVVHSDDLLKEINSSPAELNDKFILPQGKREDLYRLFRLVRMYASSRCA